MIIPVGITLIILFAGSYFSARQLAMRKNYSPDFVILVGLLLGIVAFGIIWVISTVFGGAYARWAAIGVFAVMPAALALVLPTRN